VNMQQFSAVFMVASSVTAMLFTLGLGSSVSMPDNAKVVLDMDEALYFAPSCAVNEAHQLLRASVRRAREMKFKPDPRCANSGAFTQEGRSPIGSVLEWAGILSPLRLRWNADGSWNW
jgi:hypothetical protein